MRRVAVLVCCLRAREMCAGIRATFRCGAGGRGVRARASHRGRRLGVVVMRSRTPPGFESWPPHEQANWFAAESRRHADKAVRFARIALCLQVVALILWVVAFLLARGGL